MVCYRSENSADEFGLCRYFASKPVVASIWALAFALTLLDRLELRDRVGNGPYLDSLILCMMIEILDMRLCEARTSFCLGLRISCAHTSLAI